MPLRVEQDGDDLLLWIKAVPGSSRDQVAGLLGDRLKLKVSLPAEGGKANAAICRLVAQALGIPARRVAVESGATSPAKVLRITGATAEHARRQLDT